MSNRVRNRFLSDSDIRIIAKAKKLVEDVTVEDLAEFQLPQDSVYKQPKSTAKFSNHGRGGSASSSEGKSWGMNSSPGHHAGGSPPQYMAVEMLEDLRLALSRDTIDAEEVLGPYLKLTAMLNR